MVNVLVPIADGTEEMEAVVTIDVLRRAGLDVCVASVMEGRQQVTSAHNLGLVADKQIAECNGTTWDVIAMPGGMPGAVHLHDSTTLKDLLVEQQRSGRWIAAICATPAVVLGRHGLLNGAKATCYPAFQEELAEKTTVVKDQKVVVDGKIITSQGPATAIHFALAIVENLCGAEKAQEVASGMLFTE
jgi:4-methyl-5(b-hydroxyethyl)-thiazole monophosphate biosynthesis